MRKKHETGYKYLILDIFWKADPGDLLPIRKVDEERIELTLKELTEREESVIRMRFALGADFHTLKEIGRRYGITGESSRRIEAKALQKLRRPHQKKILETLFRSVLEKRLEQAERAISDLQWESKVLTAQIDSDRSIAGDVIAILGSVGQIRNRKDIVPAPFSDSIDRLELSERSANCLKNANILTIGEIVRKTEPELLRTKNFGRRCLNELKNALAKMGLQPGMQVEF